MPTAIPRLRKVAIGITGAVLLRPPQPMQEVEDNKTMSSMDRFGDRQTAYAVCDFVVGQLKGGIPSSSA